MPNKPLTYALIDLDAIAHNVRLVRMRLKPSSELFAVVKANGYGHGATAVARTALANGATRLAVARLAEGIELREAGINVPILLMGYCLPTDSGLVLEYGLTTTANTAIVAQTLSQLAAKQGKTAIVHVKVDSGMGRYGLLPNEVVSFVNQISQLPNLDLEGIFTHFATADEPDKTFTIHQFNVFQQVLADIEAAGHKIRLRHAANSAAALAMLPEVELDGVRLGIGMVGLSPANIVDPTSQLRPALSLRSHVARVRILPAGSGVSYGHTHITTREETAVALIPVGYGDGYHRQHSNRGCVLIHGQRAPILRRVCMDQFVVDVTNIEGVRQDDKVVLIGSQGSQTIHAEEVAGWAKTINYEVTTSLLPRVPRVSVGGDPLVTRVAYLSENDL